jgi:non-homologous end joining protein Ku
MSDIRAHVSDLTLRISLPNHGVIETHGRLLSVQSSKTAGRGDGRYKLCTAEGVPVKRAYVDPTTGIPVEDENLRRYIQGNQSDSANKEPEVKRILSPEEYEEVKKAKASELPKNVVELTIHPGDTEDKLWSTSERNSYVFAANTVDPQHAESAEVIRAMLDAGYILVSVANVRNSEGFYRLKLWRGQMVLESMVYSDEINPHEVIDLDAVDPQLRELAANVAERLVEDFDADAYRNTRLERVRAIEAGEAGDIVADAVDKAQKRRSVKDTMSALLDSLG